MYEKKKKLVVALDRRETG